MSISIFSNHIDGEDFELTDDLLSSVSDVINNKSTKIVRSGGKVIVLEYSQNGPFTEPVEGWAPVKVYCLQKWKSGGVKNEYFEKEEPPTQANNVEGSLEGERSIRTLNFRTLP